MEKTFNVLDFESITTCFNYDKLRFSAELYAKITFNCSVIGTKYKMIVLISKGYGNTEEEAIYNAIDYFVKHRFQQKNTLFINSTNKVVSIEHNGIDKVNILFNEPIYNNIKTILSGINYKELNF